jgi:hypothetical protein
MQQWDAAAQEFEQALIIRRETGSEALSVDTLAGLALVAMQRSEPEQALDHVSEVLAWLEDNPAAGVESPVQVYLICYRVLLSLTTLQDELAWSPEKVLDLGHALLVERADQIQDEGLRQQFMANITPNRELHRIWTARHV